MVGIVTYGSYVPKYRISVEEIASVWGENGQALSRGLNIIRKSVPGPDEDTITISVEAARNALVRAAVNPALIGAIYVGSESHPYAVKPSATVVGEAIGATPVMTAADFEFACKAGTAALQAVIGMTQAGMINYGMVIGADTSQGRPGNVLEYTASAGGAAFLIGKEDVIAEVTGTYSFTTDTPDFWRREGEKYPSHGGRFTGEPAYFRHLTTAASKMMEYMGSEPKDYDYAVFHQPNGKFPLKAAKVLGFDREQVDTGLVTPLIGNTYSGSALLGLTAVLDEAKPGNRILLVSYGSGAGSDAFDITVTDAITSFDRDAAMRTRQYMEDDYEMINYSRYAKFMGKIVYG